MERDPLSIEAEAYARLQQLRDAMQTDAPRAIIEKLAFAITQLRIMVATQDATGIHGAIRHADAALGIWDAWREGSSENARG